MRGHCISGSNDEKVSVEKLTLRRNVRSAQQTIKALLREPKLIALLLALCLPLLPTLAQNQPETPSPSVAILSAQERRFNLSSDLHFASAAASVSLNRIPEVAPLALAADLPLSTLSAATPPKNTLLLPTDSCFSPSQIVLVSACLAPPPKKFAIGYDKLDLYPIKPVQPAPVRTERFHWKAAL